MKVAILCAYCGCGSMKEAGSINRAINKGAALYCNRECAGKNRRVFKTDAQKRADKAAYDAEFRVKNRARLKAEKHAYFRRTYDPAKAAVERKARAGIHAEYCRRPEYKAWKRGYDRRYRASTKYGPFGEAFLVLQDLETEIAARASRYEIYAQNGLLNKAKERKRGYTQSIGG